MKKIAVLILLFTVQFFVAQTIETNDPYMSDVEKEALYLKFTKEVKNYSMKQFEELFFEYQKQSFSSEILTKEQFYNYTIKIAAFSERLAGLYPKEKETAMQNKKDWLSKSYGDYLQSKKKSK